MNAGRWPGKTPGVECHVYCATCLLGRGRFYGSVEAGGYCVGEGGISVPLLTTAATAPMAFTPSPVTGFTFGHSQTALEGAAPPQKTSDVVAWCAAVPGISRGVASWVCRVCPKSAGMGVPSVTQPPTESDHSKTHNGS